MKSAFNTYTPEQFIEQHVFAISDEIMGAIEDEARRAPQWEELTHERETLRQIVEKQTGFILVDKFEDAIARRDILLQEAVYRVGLRHGMALARVVFEAKEPDNAPAVAG